jgi:hypothetical protein
VLAEGRREWLIAHGHVTPEEIRRAERYAHLKPERTS